MYNEKSKYCYPDSDVLINHGGFRNQKQLDEFEYYVSYFRAMELQLKPLHGAFDLSHLCAMHSHMFGDVYPFAGKLRTENIAKDDFLFCQWQYIKDEANKLFQELRREQFLEGLSRDQLADRLAYYMAEINVLHPFREGNGRTSREFIRSLALVNGYELSWSQIKADELLRASIKSVTNTKDLSVLIHAAIRNSEPDPSLFIGRQRERD